jgi:hypothetical protein
VSSSSWPLIVRSSIVLPDESGEPSSLPIKGVDVRRNLAGSRGVSFALAFVTRHADVDSLAKSFAKADGNVCVLKRPFLLRRLMLRRRWIRFRAMMSVLLSLL